MAVTKQQFDKATANHQPNKMTVWYFKYFSQSTKSEDKWLQTIFQIVLVSLFILGFGGVIFEMGWLGSYSTYLFALLLFSWGLGYLAVVIMNNIRVTKIRKELGLTSKEYDQAVNDFGYGV